LASELLYVFLVKRLGLATLVALSALVGSTPRSTHAAPPDPCEPPAPPPTQPIAPVAPVDEGTAAPQAGQGDAPPSRGVSDVIRDIATDMVSSYLNATKENAIQLLTQAIENSDAFKKKLDERIDLEAKKRKIRKGSIGYFGVRGVARAKAHALVEDRMRMLFENPSEFFARAKAGTLFEEDPPPP